MSCEYKPVKPVTVHVGEELRIRGRAMTFEEFLNAVSFEKVETVGEETGMVTESYDCRIQFSNRVAVPKRFLPTDREELEEFERLLKKDRAKKLLRFIRNELSERAERSMKIGGCVCSSCGYMVKDEYRYCPFCGKTLERP